LTWYLFDVLTIKKKIKQNFLLKVKITHILIKYIFDYYVSVTIYKTVAVFFFYFTVYNIL